MPEMRILVLTGYDDFEYARRCIKLKVHDFFLKPIDEGRR
jgi:two-component system response regulator YesN